MSVLESASRMGFEGIISKELRAPYRSGRAGSWLKIKSRAGQEVIIGGWTQEGAKLRSLIAGVHRGKKLFHVGRVGTGFSERVMRERAAQAESGRKRQESLRRRHQPAQGSQHALGAARTGGRDRIRRLDR